MRKLLVMGFAVIGFTTPIGTVPAQPGIVLSTEATAKDTARDRIICRDRVATGSHLAYARDCHTRAQWDEITRQARDYINGQQLKGLNAAPPNG